MNGPSWRRACRRVLGALTEPGWKTWFDYATLIAIAAVAIVHSRSYSGVVIDDAFITFRHASNLIHGQGFSCNPGEHVEGTSSLLLALLMAFPLLVGADPYRSAALLGSVTFAACCWAAYVGVRACTRDESSRVLALGAALLVASSSRLAFHSQTGMETLLYASLVAAAVALQLAASARERPTPAWAGVFGVAALTRPEGFAFFLLALAIGCVRRGRSPGALGLAQAELKRFCLVFGPGLLFRLAYFGSWLPNPVLAKGGHLDWLFHSAASAAFERLAHGPGASLLVGYAQNHPIASSLLVGTILLDRTRQAGVTAVTFAIGCAGLAVFSDGDWMPYDRLLTPSIAPLAMGAVLGLRGIFFHSEQRTRWGHLTSHVFATAALLLMVARARAPLDTESVRLISLERVREMGRRLAPLTREDDLVATEEVGILPYYWGARTLDMLGLCDKHIARAGKPTSLGIGRADLAYVVAQRPTFYAFQSASEAARFYTQAGFASHQPEYALLQFPYHFLEPLKALPLTILVRRDRKDLSALTHAVGGRLLEPSAEFRRLGHLQ
jgi:arabinofuranosyltransferase